MSRFLAKISPMGGCADCGAEAPGLEGELVHSPECPLMLALEKAAKASNYQAWATGTQPEWPWRLTDEQRAALRVLDAAVQFLQGAEQLSRAGQAWVHGRLQDVALSTNDPHAKATLEAMRQYLASYLYQRRW